METNQLKDLSASELRTLLILKIRQFTDSLEEGFPLIKLESMREEMRTIADMLKAKELGHSHMVVEGSTQIESE